MKVSDLATVNQGDSRWTQCIVVDYMFCALVASRNRLRSLKIPLTIPDRVEGVTY